ncbi:MAG: carbamoyltransferase N-terminal domain-containing protein [Humidesulfovibrio sp.]|nr:carbamoyltransferase N-terminal domain-containing protein [Humidesulfovibrio sp.]
MTLTNRTNHRMILRHHARIGHIFIPNLKARVPHEAGGYFVQTNSEGFRSDIEFVGPKGSQSRILFFGDSMTAGDGCDNAERFSDLVGQSLGCEVYNYGLSGSGTDQQVLVMEEAAAKVDADAIILCVYVENIQRNLLSSRPTLDRSSQQIVRVPKPFFRLEGGNLVLHNTPVPLARELAQPGDVHHEGMPGLLHLARGLAARMRKNPRLTRALRPLLSPKTSDYCLLRSLFPRLAGYQPVPEYDDINGEACQLMSALLRRARALSKGKPLIIMPIPTLDHVLGKAKANFQRFFNQFEDPSSGVFVANLHSYLARLPFASRKRLTFDYDAHFSCFGHQTIAKFLVKTLKSLGIPSAHPAPLPPDAEPTMPYYILGLSCYYHNSAACLLRDGEILAAAEEERFTRIKHDRRFPHAAINYCLEEAGIHARHLSAVVFYDDPELTFERMMATVASAGPEGRDQWMRMMPSWVCYKLRIPHVIRRSLHGYRGPILKNMHHRSHAASAFFPSPFEQAAILTIDGVGEWATATIARGTGNKVEMLREMRFPHSLGLLYSAFTQFLGFKVNSGEYKVMGLAPYGEPRFLEQILSEVINLAEDGSLRLNLEHFTFLSQPAMVGSSFERLFGPARQPETPLTQRDLDLARSVQAVTEEAVLRMARTAHALTGEQYLCLAGGVALNCVANGRLLREGPFADIWIQPAAGDAGGALGAALDVWHSTLGHPRRVSPKINGAQKSSLLGPSYSGAEIRAFLESHGLPYQSLHQEERPAILAELAAKGKVIGHFSGRMEYGPRALGARSIIADARNREMQSVLNLKIKYRESFRPFAPIVLEEKAKDYFELDRPSPYMLIVAPVVESRRIPFALRAGQSVHDAVREPRSEIPAVTHVDYSARIQTVGGNANPPLRNLLKAFETLTGCAVMVNTSFNVRGEPIVNTPRDAYHCFMNTEMDVLALGDFLLLKEEQPAWQGSQPHKPPPSTDFNPNLLATLDDIFLHDFQPAADALSDPLHLQGKGTSNWECWLARQAPQEFGHASERAPEGVTTSWTNRPMARALGLCLAKILALGTTYASEEELREEIADNLYIMF